MELKANSNSRAFKTRGDPSVLTEGSTKVVRNSWRVKVLECRNRAQTFQHQRKLSQLWSHQGQGKSSISEKDWKAAGSQASTDTALCSKPSPPFPGSCPRIIPVTAFHSWDLLPQECLPGQYLVIKWLFCKENTNICFDPFVLCHPKEPKNSSLI